MKSEVERKNCENTRTMTEREFLKDWVNDTKNEYNEKDHHEYSEREVLDMLRKWKEQLKQKIEEDFKKFQSGEDFYSEFHELKNPPSYMDKQIILMLDVYKVRLIENVVA